MPKVVSRASERLRRRWASSSQVKPMPPWTWMLASRGALRRFRRHQAGGVDAHGPAGVGGLVDGHGGGVHAGPGDVDGDDGVGQQVLDRLERADDLAELLALAGVLGAHVDRGLAEPDLERRGQQPAAQHQMVDVVRDDVAPGQGIDRRHGCERIEGTGEELPGGRIAPFDAVGMDDEQRVERVEVLDHRRTVGHRFDQADDRRAVDGAVDTEAGSEEGGDGGAGQRDPAELLEHDGRLGETQPNATVALGQRDAEHAHRRQLAPQRPVDGPWGVLGGVAGVVVDPGGEKPAQLALQGDLVVGELEVHQRSLGRPSRRSPTMLRWIWAVPAAIDSDRA